MPTIQYSARSARLSVGVSKDNKWSKSFDIRRMTAVDRRFNRIRQVAAMCPPMRSHLRHMANTIELVHFSAHSSPQPKRQMDRFNRFCTDDRKVSLYFTVIRPFPPQNCPFSWGDLVPNMLVPWAHPSPQPKRQLECFSRFARLASVTD